MRMTGCEVPPRPNKLLKCPALVAQCITSQREKYAHRAIHYRLTPASFARESSGRNASLGVPKINSSVGEP